MAAKATFTGQGGGTMTTEQRQQEERDHWAAQPETISAYFNFPAEHITIFGRPRPYRDNFRPALHTYVEKTRPEDAGIALIATVKTWDEVQLGVITSAHVYRHNRGGRFVSLRMIGTNGATYHGRASWDNGTAIRLRKAKTQ